MKPKTILMFLLIAIFVVVLLQNTQVVELRLLFWKLSMSRIILFPVTLIIGLIIGFIMAKLDSKKKLTKKEYGKSV
ncbi:MAG: lipopolysaccharide assembly protein LapA domain-containing protein [Candidatus Cloacimonadota bacterium]|nr:lipopolysaccharide assembly protein LapA domain-containing protein [Candidatus Cloacimonadota bacterium]